MTQSCYRDLVIDGLRHDFLAAQESNCGDPRVWLALAMQYRDLGANMNYAYCIRRAVECVESGADIAGVKHIA